ncbi:MAG: phosphopantetheine adenylyltransferase [Methanolobus sp.]|nr:phosphopantetheine adenylyltransferase [Methanolobus sp.]
MARVVVGGTFECLHDGHRELLRKAFELADDGEMDIGLTSNEMAHKRPRPVPDYSVRKKRLLKYIRKIAANTNYTIVELKDPYGNTLTKDYDYIVVSPETYPVALKINQLRRERNMQQMEIVRIEYILADDKEPISSTRIVRGEIDIHGHLRHTQGHDL